MDLVIFCLQLLVLTVLIILFIRERTRTPKIIYHQTRQDELVRLLEDEGIDLSRPCEETLAFLRPQEKIEEDLPAFLKPQAD